MATKKQKPTGASEAKAPTGAILSKYLRSIALDVETITDDGSPVTKAAALAKLVWQYALGFEQDINPDHPDKGKARVPPAVWAIELLYNRIEGKIPVAVIEDNARSLTEKVSDLAKARVNALAKASVEDEDARADDEA
jgi:hypothetical protein